MFKTNHSVGMTLIELMLALMLSTFIISALFEIYVMAEKNRLMQKNAITLQENAYVITQLLKEYVRRIAYTGCGKLTPSFPFKNNLRREVSLKNKITPYLNVDVKPGTDAIQLQYFSMHQASLIKATEELTVLYATHHLHLAAGDEAVISDCRHAETFRVKQVVLEKGGIQKIISEQPLTQFYEKNSAINKLEQDTFLVSTTHSKSGFFMKNNPGEKIELVADVEGMRVRYTVLEDQQLVDYPLKALRDATAVKSLSFTFQLHAGDLHKPWYVYVALP